MHHDNRDLRKIRRGCTNREVRATLLRAIQSGARYKLTKKGVILYGPNGVAVTHFTVSDHRGVKNLKASLKAAGIG